MHVLYLSVALSAAMAALSAQAQTEVEFGPDGALIVKSAPSASSGPAVIAFSGEQSEVMSYTPVPQEMKVFTPVEQVEESFAGTVAPIETFGAVEPDIRSTPILTPPPPPPPSPSIPLPPPPRSVPTPPPLLEDLLRQQPVSFRAITFESGSATLEADAYRHIDGIAAALHRDPSLRIAIIGHTDDVGSIPDNQDLSERRARAVVQTLTVQHGIDPARLEAAGRGESQPVADNATGEGRAQNRRVELRLVE
jgi:outer membrane protein OmpA-like peptidoglycan-associated protein